MFRYSFVSWMSSFQLCWDGPKHSNIRSIFNLDLNVEIFAYPDIWFGGNLVFSLEIKILIGVFSYLANLFFWGLFKYLGFCLLGVCLIFSLKTEYLDVFSFVVLNQTLYIEARIFAHLALNFLTLDLNNMDICLVGGDPVFSLDPNFLDIWLTDIWLLILYGT